MRDLLYNTFSRLGRSIQTGVTAVARALTDPYLVAAAVSSGLKIFTTWGDSSFRTRDATELVYGSKDLHDPVVQGSVGVCIIFSGLVMMLTVVPLTFNKCRKKSSSPVEEFELSDFKEEERDQILEPEEEKKSEDDSLSWQRNVSYYFFGGMGIVSLGFMTFSSYNGFLRACDLFTGEDIDPETFQVLLGLMNALLQCIPNYVTTQEEVLHNAISDSPILVWKSDKLGSNLHIIFDTIAAAFLANQGAGSALQKLPAQLRPNEYTANIIAGVSFLAAGSTRLMRNGKALRKLYDNEFKTPKLEGSACSAAKLHHQAMAVAVPLDAISTGTYTAGSILTFFKKYSGINCNPRDLSSWTASKTLVMGTAVGTGLAYGISTKAFNFRLRERVFTEMFKKKNVAEEKSLLSNPIKGYGAA